MSRTDTLAYTYLDQVLTIVMGGVSKQGVKSASLEMTCVVKHTLVLIFVQLHATIGCTQEGIIKVRLSTESWRRDAFSVTCFKVRKLEEGPRHKC